MARCGCGGAQCGCAIVAGDNVDIDGTGSAANPFVVSAVTNCPEVRACLHGAAGVAYNQASGTFSAALSGQAGNNLTVNPDGGLFVPTGAATVNAGCGLAGDGSGSAPLTVNTGTWPLSCSLDAVGGGVYCDSTGTLRTDPPKQLAYFTDGGSTTYASPLVPANPTPIITNTLALVNPDPCRTATVLVYVEADVTFTLPGGATGVYTIDGNQMWVAYNSGTATVANYHAQTSRVLQVTVPPGATVNQATEVGLTRGAGGARYTSIDWATKAFLFT